MFRRILVPIDGSPTSNKGFEEAMALAKNQAGRLCLLHVVDESLATRGFDGTMYVPANYVDEFLKALREEGRKLLAKAEAKARRRHLKVDIVLLESFGHRVADLIVKQAKKWRADVVVLGTHGRRGLSRLLMGSDAEMVVREAPVPVLLVRSPGVPRKRRTRRGRS